MTHLHKRGVRTGKNIAFRQYFSRRILLEQPENAAAECSGNSIGETLILENSYRDF
jgi:hypothetical protein